MSDAARNRGRGARASSPRPHTTATVLAHPATVASTAVQGCSRGTLADGRRAGRAPPWRGRAARHRHRHRGRRRRAMRAEAARRASRPRGPRAATGGAARRAAAAGPGCSPVERRGERRGAEDLQHPHRRSRSTAACATRLPPAGPPPGSPAAPAPARSPGPRTRWSSRITPMPGGRKSTGRNRSRRSSALVHPPSREGAGEEQGHEDEQRQEPRPGPEARSEPPATGSRRTARRAGRAAGLRAAGPETRPHWRARTAA